VTGASGGAAGDAGFMVSAGGSNNAVVGFSLEGATIPTGSGVLVVLEVEGDGSACITNVILADSNGDSLDSDVEDCLTISAGGGGTDPYCGDGECNGDENSNNCPEDCEEPDGTVSIMYNSDAAIAGFQFNVTGVTITGASGGAAEGAGFMISANEETVLGFSLDGATIPAGSGVLVVLDIEGDASAACLGEVILSDSDANVIDNMIQDCTNIVVGGGTDPYCGDGESYYLLH
jgi:hypothetical protein